MSQSMITPGMLRHAGPFSAVSTKVIHRIETTELPTFSQPLPFVFYKRRLARTDFDHWASHDLLLVLEPLLFT